MTENLWSKSQREAWSYVEKGVNEGYTQTEALAEYRSGGGKIRTSSWGELWHRAEVSSERWNNLYQLKQTDEVPESFYAQTGIAFKEKYVMQFTTDIRSATGEILHNIHRQVESAERLTLKQWSEAATESLQEDLSIDVSQVYSVRDIAFFERQG